MFRRPHMMGSIEQSLLPAQEDFVELTIKELMRRPLCPLLAIRHTHNSCQ